jgi:hypothetical protein
MSVTRGADRRRPHHRALVLVTAIDREGIEHPLRADRGAIEHGAVVQAAARCLDVFVDWPGTRLRSHGPITVDTCRTEDNVQSASAQPTTGKSSGRFSAEFPPKGDYEVAAVNVSP